MADPRLLSEERLAELKRTWGSYGILTEIYGHIDAMALRLESARKALVEISHRGFLQGNGWHGFYEISNAALAALAAPAAQPEPVACTTGGVWGSCRDGRDADLCANCAAKGGS